VSPILVRPVREQLEHDRLIRFLLLNKYKRRYEAAGNTGDERVASIKVGSAILFPDIVLTEGKKVAGVVEVETGESVNNLEALAEWVHFSKARVPFYLYVPVASYDSARRLCELRHIRPAEIWTYRPAMDGFDLIRAHQNPAAAAAARVAVTPSKPKPEVKTPAPLPPKPKAPEKTAAKAVAKPLTPPKPPKVTKGRPKAKPKAATKGNTKGKKKR
jgi:cell division septation protein DedD